MNAKTVICLVSAGILLGFAARQVSLPKSAPQVEATNRSQARAVEDPPAITGEVGQPEAPSMPVVDPPASPISGSPRPPPTDGASLVTQEEALPTTDAETANDRQMTAWKARFADWIAHCGDQGKASERFVAELGEAYQGLAASELEKLSAVTGADRFDQLATIETELQQGASTLLAALEITSIRPGVLLAESLDAVAAESQYGDLNLSHPQRVALLKLDEERGVRLRALLVSTGFGPDTDTRIQNELDPWYEEQTRLIVGVEAETE